MDISRLEWLVITDFGDVQALPGAHPISGMVIVGSSRLQSPWFVRCPTVVVAAVVSCCSASWEGAVGYSAHIC